MIKDVEQILPDVFEGWTAYKEIIMTVPADIYNYIDGGAELYLSYGFNKAVSRTYIKNGKEVLAEVYDLAEARNAFGVFTQTREYESGEFGQGTYRIPGAVFFWKDRFYVTLSAWEQGEVTDNFIDKLAAFVDKTIESSGVIPEIMGLIPGDMIPSGYRYFHHYVWLNSFFFLSDQNILNIDTSTDAILAKFEEGDQRKHLLLVRYSGYAEASAAWKSFATAFFPEGLSNNCIMLEDGTWMSAVIKNRHIVAVFNAESCQSALDLINQSINKI